MLKNEGYGERKMIKIAVCDDENIYGKRIETVIAEYMMEKHLSYEIDLYPSGMEFVRLEAEMTKYQIVFLDINMDGLDGIETAKKLREFCKDTYLVFVTAYINYTIEGYKVEAIRYILKNTPNFKETIYESLDAICEKMNCVFKVESFDFKEKKKKLSSESIIYIESNLHKLSFWIQEERWVEYTLYDTLNAIENKFDTSNFVRIHQSYLVNLKYITDIVNYKVYLVNGIVLPVAKPRFKEVREKFAIYKGEI